MKITFLGGGNMATALIGGLVQRGQAGAQIRVVEPLAAARERLAAGFGVHCHEGVGDEALDCDALVLAVKPQQMREALTPLAGRLRAQLVVSIAAGMRMADIARWLGGYARIVRCMPNTPALIGAGITGLCAHASVSEAERRAAEQILAAVGETLWIGDETLMDAVTAISGSGPAYVFYFIEALEEAALALGFDAHQARRLAKATVLGAARLAEHSDEAVALLRQRVTSKGGTTEAALGALEAGGLKALVLRAAAAADARGREMGDLMGRD